MGSCRFEVDVPFWILFDVVANLFNGIIEVLVDDFDTIVFGSLFVFLRILGGEAECFVRKVDARTEIAFLIHL